MGASIRAKRSRRAHRCLSAAFTTPFQRFAVRIVCVRQMSHVPAVRVCRRPCHRCALQGHPRRCRHASRYALQGTLIHSSDAQASQRVFVCEQLTRYNARRLSAGAPSRCRRRRGAAALCRRAVPPGLRAVDAGSVDASAIQMGDVGSLAAIAFVFLFRHSAGCGCSVNNGLP